MEGGVSYETLQDLLRSERRSNKLTPLPNGFWAELQDFLREIEADFREAQEEDPFDRKVMMLTDRVKNARHAAESVWSLRERKIAMIALAQVKEQGHAEGLTKKEDGLYNEVLDVLREGRRRVFEGTAAEADYVARERPPPAAPKAAPEAAPEPAKVEAPPEPEPAKPVIEVPPDTPDEEVQIIRALSAIPPFVGPDMQTYQLAKGDVASVPDNVAGLLIKRGMAAAVNA